MIIMKFKKCLSDRGCATDFTGHPLPETTLKLMWMCQEKLKMHERVDIIIQ